MKQRHYYIFLLLSAFGFMLCAFNSEAQQLKLGSNPTQIKKSAVLQIDSKNQGVLLPRVPDTTDMASTDIPDGMVIYFTDEGTSATGDHAGLYIRKDGRWQPLVVESDVGIVSLNGDKTKKQTVDVISSYTGYTAPQFIDDLSGQHHLLLPNASADTRGLVSMGGQDWAGIKTFLDAPIMKSLSPGSVAFIGSGRSLSEDAENFYWDISNKRLGLKTNTPQNTLEINSGTSLSGLTFKNMLSTTPVTVTGGTIGVDAFGNVVRLKGIEDLTLGSGSGSDDANGGGLGLYIDNSDPGKTVLNIPDAGDNVRGVVNTGAQTFKGSKTINSGVTGVSGLAFTNLTSSQGAIDLNAAPIGVSSSGSVVKANKTPTYYDKGGDILNPQVTKILVDTVQGNSVGEIKTISIPNSIGFSKILSIQLTAQIVANGSYVVVANVENFDPNNTSYIKIRIIEFYYTGGGGLLGLGGLLAGGNFTIPNKPGALGLGSVADPKPYIVYYRIEGY